MWDSFVAWGQSYGLWATIAVLIFIIIMDYADNARLKRALEQSREEKKYFEDRYNDLIGGDDN